MAFKVKGVDVFSDNGALDVPTIKNLRNGLPADITDGDELAIYDSNSGIGPEGDIMRVTVDEFFNRDLNTKFIRNEGTELQYTDANDSTRKTVKEDNNLYTLFDLAGGQGSLTLANFNLVNVATLRYSITWTNSDFSRGIADGYAYWTGSTIIIVDPTLPINTDNEPASNFTNTQIPELQFLLRRTFAGSNGLSTNIPFFQFSGSTLIVAVQNNGGPSVRTNMNISYEATYFPDVPPAP